MPSDKPVIRVNYGLTISDGNYGSVRLDASLERPLEPNEDYKTAFHKCWQRVYNEVNIQAKHARKKLGIPEPEELPESPKIRRKLLA